METPLNASSTTAGALMSRGQFRVPQFQREYAWEQDEVDEFFNDLAHSLNSETYFLGLIIVTGEGSVKDVVDGQQRLLTLSLLASALYHQARKYERRALAERVQSTFLRSIDFESDEEFPRLELSSEADNFTLQQILTHPASELVHLDPDQASVSGLLLTAYRNLTSRLEENLRADPFKRLGFWADFLTNKLYFAIFVHPNPASAYRVFEVINTRGKELTTADLLKSYVLSQTGELQRQRRYAEWQRIAYAFDGENPNVFVQFIRHAVTTERGHTLPRDLYDVLSGGHSGKKPATSPAELIQLLEKTLPVYLQLMDPTREGPANSEQLAVFSVLNSLNVVSVRPILMAMMGTPNATQGMRALLRLVVHRIVVGNLGTGNVERRFGQTAQKIAADGSWEAALESLSDLNHQVEEFRQQVHRRSMNRNLLSVLRRSVLQRSITPEPVGFLYHIKPRETQWTAEDEDRAAYWASTIGNSFLAEEARRPMNSSAWTGFKNSLLPLATAGEWTEEIRSHADWNVDAIIEVGEKMASVAAEVWYE